MHRQQSDPHINGAHPQPGGGDRSNRGTAGHIVIRHELLIRNVRRLARRRENTGTYRIGCISLIRVDLQQRASTGKRAHRRIVMPLVVRVHQMPGIRRKAHRIGERAAVFVLAFPASLREPHQHILQERTGGTAAGFRPDLFVVESRKHHGMR